MVTVQRSRPRLDSCVTFDADAVRVGDARVPCRVEQGSVVVVLGDRLRPLTLGERALALSLGAEGLARAVWQLSGGSAARWRSIEEQAVVEAVALYLAGAANSVSLHLAVVAAGRYLGGPARVEALGATIADDLAASLASGEESRAEAGWTVIRIGAADEAAGDRADLREPASVRAALVAALLERAELPFSPEVADAPPVATSAAAAAAPAPASDSASDSTPAAQPGEYAAIARGRWDAPRARGPAIAALPVPAAGAPTTPPADPSEAATPVVAPSRFPAGSAPKAPSAPGLVDPGPPGVAWAFTGQAVALSPVSRPFVGADFGSTAAGVGPRGQILTGIDWQALPTLGLHPAPGVASGHAPGPTDASDLTANVPWAAHPLGARDVELVDAVLGISSELAEQLLAVADRRGLA